MSSENNTGTLGEGTGIRETTNMNSNLKNSDKILEEMVGETKQIVKLVLIGKHSRIRCHNCDITPLENKGLFIQINGFIAWFHNEECLKKWNVLNTKYKTGAVIDQNTGEQIISNP
jgi:hypothetical protein